MELDLSRVAGPNVFRPVSDCPVRIGDAPEAGELLISDNDGTLQFELSGNPGTIVISAVGYKPCTIPTPVSGSSAHPIDLGDIHLQWTEKLLIGIQGPVDLKSYEIKISGKARVPAKTPFGTLEYRTFHSQVVHTNESGSVSISAAAPPQYDLRVLVTAQDAPGHAAMMSRLQEVPAVGQEKKTLLFDFNDSLSVHLAGIPGDLSAGRTISLERHAGGDETFEFGRTNDAGVCIFPVVTGLLGFHINCLDGACRVLLQSSTSGATDFESPRGQLVLEPSQPLEGIILKDREGQRVTEFFVGLWPSKSQPSKKDRGVALVPREVLDRHEILWFKTRDVPFFPVSIAEMRSNVDAGFLSATLPTGLASISLRSKEPSSLLILARRMQKKVDYATPERSETLTTWSLKNLPPGTYSLIWSEKGNWRQFERPFTTIRVRPGSDEILDVSPPLVKKTTVVIENWDKIPPRHRPKKMYNEGRFSQRIVASSFQWVLSWPLAGKVRMHPSLSETTWDALSPRVSDDGRLVLKLPTTMFRDVALTFLPKRKSWRRFVSVSLAQGRLGYAHVSIYRSNCHYEDALGAIQIPIMRQLSMSKAFAVAAEEKEQSTVIRGLIPLHQLSRSEQELTVHMPGREVGIPDAVGGKPPVVHLVFETHLGKVTAITESYGDGHSGKALWIPDAASEVKIFLGGKVLRVPTSRIKDVLPLEE